MIIELRLKKLKFNGLFLNLKLLLFKSHSTVIFKTIKDLKKFLWDSHVHHHPTGFPLKTHRTKEHSNHRPRREIFGTSTMNMKDRPDTKLLSFLCNCSLIQPQKSLSSFSRRVPALIAQAPCTGSIHNGLGFDDAAARDFKSQEVYECVCNGGSERETKGALFCLSREQEKNLPYKP
jgi:hypothetical protein